jgi:hypothetical membrane protein
VQVPVRLGAACGIAGPVAFVAGWLVNGLRTPGYDPWQDAISELAREGAPTQAAMTAAFVAFGVLVPVWARVLGRELGRESVQVVVTAAGVATLAVAALPLTREGGQPQDTAHAVAAAVGYLAMALTPLVAAPALRGRARTASVLTGALSAAALGATLLVEGPGGLQRLGLTVVDAWHVVVAALVLGGSRLRRSP